jgi:DNA-binding LacI/PurR family transcriptional regulator
VVAYLRAGIADGTFVAGAQIPTEHALVEQFGVSRGTVRHAMSTLVHEGLLERVRGRGTFVRSIAALPLPLTAAKVEKRIGVILSHPGGEMELRTLVGIESAARERGYAVSFSYTDEDAQQQAYEIQRLRADRVAGLIIFPIRDIEDDTSIHDLRTDEVPFVLIDRYLPRVEADSVLTDNVGGGYIATEHLISLGHTRIGFVHSYAGTLATTSVRDRWLGYRQALDTHQLPYDPELVYQTTRFMGNQDDFDEFFARQPLPTAVFAATDHVALGFMQAAYHHSLVIPNDLALIGFDNLGFTANVRPPLTTLAQNFPELGARASRLLMNRIESVDGPPRRIILPATLTIRDSCGTKLRARGGISAAG